MPGLKRLGSKLGKLQPDFSFNYSGKWEWEQQTTLLQIPPIRGEKAARFIAHVILLVEFKGQAVPAD